MIYNVIGNGTSRKHINLTQLEGRTFGCNAIYRDFTPSDLVFIDPKMSDEIFQAKLTCNVWTKGNLVREGWRSLRTILLSSGTTALHLASLFEPDQIHIYGMDMTLTNIYAGTSNYRPEALINHNTDPWINEMHQIIQNNPWIKYIRFKTQDCPEFNFGANYEERIL